MIVCKICVASMGFTWRKGETFASDDDLIAHLEAVHHMPVRREGETEAETQARFLARFPEAATCPDCRMRKAPWTRAS